MFLYVEYHDKFNKVNVTDLKRIKSNTYINTRVLVYYI